MAAKLGGDRIVMTDFSAQQAQVLQRGREEEACQCLQAKAKGDLRYVTKIL